MGLKTAAAIINEALVKAGNTSLTSPAQDWLNTFLAGVYAAHPWPFLRKRFTMTVPAGRTSVSVGPGTTDGITDNVVSLMRVVLADASNTGLKTDLAMYSEDDVPASADPTLIDTSSPGTTAGLMLQAGAGPYNWIINFGRTTDKVYRLVVLYHYLPALITDFTAIPPYPMDKTMVDAVVLGAMEWNNDERAEAFSTALAQRVSEDRAIFGKSSRENQKMELSRSVFPQRGRGRGGSNFF